MSRTIELTMESGAPITVNLDFVTTITPVAEGDADQGSRLAFSFTHGADDTPWRVRVIESYSEVIRMIDAVD